MRKSIKEKPELQLDCDDPCGTLGKRLPQEMLLNILRFLNIPSLGRVVQLSTFWKKLAEDSSLWKAIAENLKEKISSFLMFDKTLTWKEKVRIKFATEGYPLQLIEAFKGEQHLAIIPEIDLSQRPLADEDNSFATITTFTDFEESKVLRTIYNNIPFIFIRSERTVRLDNTFSQMDTIQELFLSRADWCLRTHSIHSSYGISEFFIGRYTSGSADEMLKRFSERAKRSCLLRG